MKALVSVGISGTGITSTDVALLARSGKTALRIESLCEDGLRVVGASPLRVLALHTFDGLSEEAIRRFAERSQLEKLVIWQTQDLSRQSLADLLGMDTLRTVSLSGEVGSLAALSSSSVEAIEFRPGTPVTDRHIRDIADAAALRHIVVHDSTDQGTVNRIKEARPDVGLHVVCSPAGWWRP